MTRVREYVTSTTYTKPYHDLCTPFQTMTLTISPSLYPLIPPPLPPPPPHPFLPPSLDIVTLSNTYLSETRTSHPDDEKEIFQGKDFQEGGNRELDFITNISNVGKDTVVHRICSDLRGDACI